jgi:hypothetical protein
LAPRVEELAPHLLAHGTTYLLRQRHQRLTGGSAAAFKGVIASPSIVPVPLRLGGVTGFARPSDGRRQQGNEYQFSFFRPKTITI